MTSKASVILCNYNQEKFLKLAIDSVLAQTYSDLELLVIDNGSVDGSQKVLREQTRDPRIRLLIHGENAAVTKRLNEAIALSTGQFISILYADDYYLPHKLERQIQEFSRLPPEYGVVYSPGYRLDALTGDRWMDNSLKLSGSILKEMLLAPHSGGFINPISPLIRKGCFIRYPFHEDVFIEGEAIFLRIALGYRFHYMDEPLVVMREHAANAGKAIKKNAAASLILLNKLVQESGFPEDLVAPVNSFRGSFMGDCGWLGIRVAEDPRWARDCFLDAIRRQPKQLLRPRTLVGLALSALPAQALRGFNGLLNRMRPHKETIAFKSEYV